MNLNLSGLSGSATFGWEPQGSCWLFVGLQPAAQPRRRTGEDNMPRGPSGSVAGIPRDEADDILKAMLTTLGGGPVTMDEIVAAAEKEEVEDPRAFARVVTELPGCFERRDGSYILAESPESAVDHRHWRITLGQADLDDARTLLRLLGNAGFLTPNLKRLRSRLTKAVAALFT